MIWPHFATRLALVLTTDFWIPGATCPVQAGPADFNAATKRVFAASRSPASALTAWFELTVAKAHSR